MSYQTPSTTYNAPPVESPMTSNLTGLIKRREVKQFDPTRDQADHAVAKSIMLERLDDQKDDERLKLLEFAPLSKAGRPRRQLTVRLDMEIFKKLDRLAKQTGRTYQAIQADAIHVYLEQ